MTRCRFSGHPVVSILLPVRNARATLPAALRSILQQSYQNWECVLVDDGSLDDSAAVAHAIAGEDPRVRVFVRRGVGLPAALQFGVTQCRGTFIARMDADDLMHPDRLRLQLEHLDQHPELAAVGCRVRLFPRSALRDGYRRYERWLNNLSQSIEIAREAFVECPVAHPTLLVRTEVLRRLGYRSCPWPEDYDLVLRMLATGYRLASLPRYLLLWRVHPKQTRQNDPRYSVGAILRCKAHFLANGILRQHESYILWGYGKTGRALRRALRAYSKEPLAVIDVHPRRLQQRRKFGTVSFVSPEKLSSLPRLPLLVSVAGAPARRQIRTFLEQLSLQEGSDWLFTA